MKEKMLKKKNRKGKLNFQSARVSNRFLFVRLLITIFECKKNNGHLEE